MKLFFFAPVLFAILASASVSPDIVASYLDSLEANYDRSEAAFLLYVVEEGQEPWPFFYIEVSELDEACFLVGLTPGVVPDSGEARTSALETLAELNWDYTFVKFTSHPETGEITANYTFSTENGLGYEAFSAMIYVVIGTIEENLEVLANL